MTRKEIAACPDAYSLRDLYRKYNPKAPIWKMEKWINYIINARKEKENI